MNEKSKIAIQAVIIAAGAFSSSALDKVLGIAWYWTDLMAAASAALAIYILERNNYFRRLKPLRVLFYTTPATFEGYWISKFEDHIRPHSFSKIYYSPHRPAWRHRGFAVDKDFSRTVNWKSISIHYNKDLRRWVFEGDWWFCKDTGTTHQHISIIEADGLEQDTLTNVVIDNFMPRMNVNINMDGKILRAELRRATEATFVELGMKYPDKIEDLQRLPPQRLKEVFNSIFTEDHTETDEAAGPVILQSGGACVAQ